MKIEIPLILSAAAGSSNDPLQALCRGEVEIQELPADSIRGRIFFGTSPDEAGADGNRLNSTGSIEIAALVGDTMMTPIMRPSNEDMFALDGSIDDVPVTRQWLRDDLPSLIDGAWSKSGRQFGVPASLAHAVGLKTNQTSYKRVRNGMPIPDDIEPIRLETIDRLSNDLVFVGDALYSSELRTFLNFRNKSDDYRELTITHFELETDRFVLSSGNGVPIVASMLPALVAAGWKINGPLRFEGDLPAVQPVLAEKDLIPIRETTWLSMIVNSHYHRSSIGRGDELVMRYHDPAMAVLLDDVSNARRNADEDTKTTLIRRLSQIDVGPDLQGNSHLAGEEAMAEMSRRGVKQLVQSASLWMDASGETSVPDKTSFPGI